MSLSFLELLDFKVFSFPSPFPKDGIKGNISVVSTNTYLIAFHCIYNKGQPPQWKTILDIWEPPRIPLKNLASLKDSSSFTAWGNSGGGGGRGGGGWVWRILEDHIVFRREWGTISRRGQSVMAGKWKIDCMPINCPRRYMIMNSSFVLLNSGSLIRWISKSSAMEESEHVILLCS